MSEYIPTINFQNAPQYDWKGAQQAGLDARAADAAYVEQMRKQNSQNILQKAVQDSTSTDPVTGKTVVDWNGAVANAAAAGADPGHLQEFMQGRSNLTSTDADNKKKVDALRDAVLNESVNQFRNAQPGDVLGLMNGALQRLKSVYAFQGMKDQEAQAQAQKDLEQRYGIDAETHGQMTTEEKIAHILQSARALESASATSSQQAIMNKPVVDANTRANTELDATFRAKLNTKDGNDPNSALSKHLRAAAIDAGVPAEAVASLSAFQIQGQYADQVRSLAGNQQVDIGTSVQASRNAQAYAGKINTVQTGMTAIGSISQNEIGKLIGLPKEKWDEWVRQDPERRAMKDAIAVYNDDNPNNLIGPGSDVRQIKQSLGTYLKNLQGKQATEQSIATARTRKDVNAPNQVPTSKAPAQKTPAKKIILQALNGKFAAFDSVADKEKIAKYLSKGAKRIQ